MRCIHGGGRTRCVEQDDDPRPAVVGLRRPAVSTHAFATAQRAQLGTRAASPSTTTSACRTRPRSNTASRATFVPPHAIRLDQNAPSARQHPTAVTCSLPFLVPGDTRSCGVQRVRSGAAPAASSRRPAASPQQQQSGLLQVDRIHRPRPSSFQDVLADGIQQLSSDNQEVIAHAHVRGR